MSMNKAGFKSGSVRLYSLEGVNFFNKKVDGYAVYIPWGIGNFYFKIKPVSEKTKFPPAESPAKIIFLGLIFKYL